MSDAISKEAFDKMKSKAYKKGLKDASRWNDLYVDANNLPRPNEWVMVYQRYSKPNFTIGRLHFEMLPEGKYKNYWEWFSNETIGSPLICPGKEYVYGWKEIPNFNSNC